MADAMLPKKTATSSKIVANLESEDSKRGKRTSKTPDKKVSSQSKRCSETFAKQTSAGSASNTNKQNIKAGNVSPLPSTSNTSDTTLGDVMTFLREIKNDQEKSNTRMNEMSSRVEEIYNYEPYEDDGDFEMYDENVADDNNNEAVEESATAESQPPAKKQKSDKDSVFKDTLEKYKIKEKVDESVDSDLAEMVNSFFRQGIPEEKFSELIQSIDRPENCEALTKTRVNQLIWDLLSEYTRSDENRIQFRQNIVVKSACLITKMLNQLNDLKKNGTDIPQEIVDLGTDAVGLLGHCNRAMNLARRDMHKPDLSYEYFHLCSSSLPYTSYLYGDDISKQVSDIDSINKVGKKVKRRIPPWYYVRGTGAPGFRGRGGRSGRGGRGGPRRGNRGSRGGRGASASFFTNQNDFVNNSYTQFPKNSRRGFGRRRY